MTGCHTRSCIREIPVQRGLGGYSPCVKHLLNLARCLYYNFIGVSRLTKLTNMLVTTINKNIIGRRASFIFTGLRSTGVIADVKETEHGMEVLIKFDKGIQWGDDIFTESWFWGRKCDGWGSIIHVKLIDLQPQRIQDKLDQYLAECPSVAKASKDGTLSMEDMLRHEMKRRMLNHVVYDGEWIPLDNRIATRGIMQQSLALVLEGILVGGWHEDYDQYWKMIYNKYKTRNQIGELKQLKRRMAKTI
jgi:hypothetical protein